MCQSAAHWGYLPSMPAAEWVIRRAKTAFLEQPVTNAMFQPVTNAIFRPVTGQAIGFGLVEDLESILDIISDGYLPVMELEHLL